MLCDKIIKKYLSQKCIGYDPDFHRTYIEGQVEFMDGTTGTVYDTAVNHADGSMSSLSTRTDRPFVAIPA